MPNPDVPADEIGLSDGFDDAVIRLERDLKSLRSAAATFSDRGRALIDRLKAIKADLAASEQDPVQTGDSRFLDAIDRLNELASFVDCAWLASRSIEDRGDRDGLSIVLDHAAMGLRKLCKTSILRPPGVRRVRDGFRPMEHTSPATHAHVAARNGFFRFARKRGCSARPATTAGETEHGCCAGPAPPACIGCIFVSP